MTGVEWILATLLEPRSLSFANPYETLCFRRVRVRKSSADAVELGWDPGLLLKILRFPPNHYKTMLKHNIQH